MAIIVVDASAFITSAVQNDDDADWASDLIDGQDLHCPALVYAECAHGLRRMERTGDVSGLEAELALLEIMALEKELYPFEPYATRIWELRHNLSCYDAWYVALAETLGCPLVTLDRRMSRAVGVECEILTP